MITRSRLVLGLAALALVAAGCDDDSDAPDLSDGFSVRGALEELPASLDDPAAFTIVADLDRASQVQGIERPNEPAVEIALPWLSAITGIGEGKESPRAFVVPARPLFGLTPEDMAAAAGWSLVDVQSFAAQVPVSGGLAVTTGDFDENTISGELEKDDDGIAKYVEGNPERPVSTMRMAEDHGRIAVSDSAAALRDWMRSGESLAGANADYADLAEALDDAEVYSAVLTGVEGGGNDPSLPERPFSAVGLGWAEDGGEPLIVATYHFGSDDAAESSVDELRGLYESGTTLEGDAQIADFLDVDDVTADGPVVVVRSRLSGDTQILVSYQMLLAREIVFTSR